MASNSRQCIQRALFSLLEEWPLQSITVSEVASRAGVSRTTYYRLYDSLESVIDDALDELFSRIEPFAPQRTSTGEYDRRIVELSVYQMLYCYQSEVDLLYPLARGNAWTVLQRRLFDFTLNLERRQGDESCQDSIGVMEQTYVAAGMTAVICQWISHRCEEPIANMLDLIMRERMANA